VSHLSDAEEVVDVGFVIDIRDGAGRALTETREGRLDIGRIAGTDDHGAPSAKAHSATVYPMPELPPMISRSRRSVGGDNYPDTGVPSEG
jgi:hypothetical protein